MSHINKTNGCSTGSDYGISSGESCANSSHSSPDTSRSELSSGTENTITPPPLNQQKRTKDQALDGSMDQSSVGSKSLDGSVDLSYLASASVLSPPLEPLNESAVQAPGLHSQEEDGIQRAIPLDLSVTRTSPHAALPPMQTPTSPSLSPQHPTEQPHNVVSPGAHARNKSYAQAAAHVSSVSITLSAPRPGGQPTTPPPLIEPLNTLPHPTDPLTTSTPHHPTSPSPTHTDVIMIDDDSPTPAQRQRRPSTKRVFSPDSADSIDRSTDIFEGEGEEEIPYYTVRPKRARRQAHKLASLGSGSSEEDYTPRYQIAQFLDKNKTVNTSTRNTSQSIRSQYQSKPNQPSNQDNHKGDETIFFTVSVANRAPTAQESDSITAQFVRYIGDHNVTDIQAPVDRLGPCFKIRKAMIYEARNFKTSSHSLRCDLVDMETAYRPTGRVNRNVNLQPKSHYHIIPKSTGIVRDIPLDTNLNKLKDLFNKRGEIVRDIQRVMTKDRRQTNTLKLTFNTEKHPLKITSTTSHDVYPCNIPYIRCNNCQEHAHRTDSCKKEFIVCPHCSGNHNHYQCRRKSRYARKFCANCYGSHGASSLNCPVFIQHKKVIDDLNNNLHAEWRKRVRQSLATPPTQSLPTSNNTNPVVIPVGHWPQLTSQIPEKNATNSDPIPTTHPTPVHTDCIKPDELKYIILDILEMKTDNMEREDKVTLIETVVNNHTKRCKPPTHLLTPNVSPVLIHNYPNIPNHQPTSTPNVKNHPYTPHTPNRPTLTSSSHTGPKPHTVKHATFNINTS